MTINNGEAFPSVQAMVDGAQVDLAELASGSWTAVLFYRGHW